MSIIATAPVPHHSLLSALDTADLPCITSCPTWCADHSTLPPLVPGDREVACHASTERTILATVTDLDGRVAQTSQIHVQAEQYDDGEPDQPTVPLVFLSVDGDTAMTAPTARELATALLWLANRIDGAR